MPSDNAKPTHHRFSSSSSSDDEGVGRQVETRPEKRDFTTLGDGYSEFKDKKKEKKKRDKSKAEEGLEMDDKGCDKEKEERREKDKKSERKRSRDDDEASNSNRESKRSDHRDKERNSERTKERERHREERSGEREDRRRDRGDERTDRRGHFGKSLAFRRDDRPPPWRNDRHDRRGRRRGREEDEPSDDRPAWATRAVVRRAEEIQQRKLLWSKPEPKGGETAEGESSKPGGGRPSTASTWNSILAASSSDTKQLDKFKRLMGMKKSDEPESSAGNEVSSAQVEAERRRQLALYDTLDQQYAVARSTTHLSRGQGLGFHS